MSSFTDTLENNVLDHYFRNQASIAPATVYLSLFTVAPTDSTAGTEVTGGGYARQAIAFDAASGGVTQNTAAESFTASGANFGTVVAIGLHTASTAGTLLAYDGITSAVVNDGDTINFAIGAITITVT